MRSDGQRSPLVVPELLDYTLSFVDSEKDLQTCALVHRSWLHPSQSRIFSTITFYPSSSGSNAAQLGRQLDILESSPHLVAFATELTIFYFGTLESLAGYLTRLASLPFTNLTTLRIDGDDHLLSTPQTHAIQHLLETPSLTSLTFHCHFARWTDEFLNMWEVCCPTIKHLRLGLASSEPLCELARDGTHGRIKLETLSTEGPSDAAWLQHAKCPFDVRGLKAIRLGFVPLGDSLPAECLDSIELFGLNITFISGVITDICRFRSVTQLHLEHLWDGPHRFHDDFTQLCHEAPPEVRNRISAIRFEEFLVPQEGLHLLDAELSNIHEYFPNLKTVQLKLHSERKTDGAELRASVEPYAPGLDPRISVKHEFNLATPWYKRIM
ncbi:hypothetical protein FB45DRAFT_910884 [Roridomyces roridus]|uniref:Uncharacterized protein n=1 Tax=Roridomyces roridus TaxID=1738132 RepID=A0AAD7BZY8_9AGAR|nr:hypothetical protein FB45DRAFT_910884 [Roridomyces roridus]